MPHEASTDERQEEIIDRLTGSTCRGILNVQVDVNGSWINIEDVDLDVGVKWSTTGKRANIASFCRTPTPAKLSFSIQNQNGKWSEDNSASEYSGLIVNDAKIRIRSGYIFENATSVTEIVDLNHLFNSFFYNLKYSGLVIIPDIAGTETDDYFKDLFALQYDEAKYDTRKLTPTGYCVHTYDSAVKGNAGFTGINVTANGTFGKVYYRFFDTKTAIAGFDTSASWAYAGATINGEKTFIFSESVYRYIQVAVIFDGTTWGPDYQVSQIELVFNSYYEYLYTGVFHVDGISETEPEGTQMPLMSVTARDNYKRAIDTDYNLPDVSGMEIDAIIKQICDDIKIPYSATSIADLTAFAARTLTTGNGTTEKKKADAVFDWLMEIINQSGAAYKYEMYMDYDSTEDDMILFVQPRPTVVEASWVMNYKSYTSLGDKKRNYDKLLQRVTAITDSHVPDSTDTLDTQTYNTAGTKTLSWVGDAQFKRYTIVINSGDAIVTQSDVTNTSIVFIITGTTIDVTITVYGDKWSSTAPAFEGEYINQTNMIAQKGFTATRVNPLIVSDAEARLIAKGDIEDYGEPIYEANKILWPYMNLIPAMNDMVLLWSKHTFLERLFFITSIAHDYNSGGDKTTFAVDDSGHTFAELGSFRYDDVMRYGQGYLYGMDLGVLVSEDDVDDINEVAPFPVRTV